MIKFIDVVVTHTSIQKGLGIHDRHMPTFSSCGKDWIACCFCGKCGKRKNEGGVGGSQRHVNLEGGGAAAPPTRPRGKKGSLSAQAEAAHTFPEGESASSSSSSGTGGSPPMPSSAAPRVPRISAFAGEYFFLWRLSTRTSMIEYSANFYIYISIIIIRRRRNKCAQARNGWRHGG